MIFPSPNFRVKSEGTVLKLRVRWGEFCQIQHCSGDGGEGLKMIKSELSGVFLSGIVENPFVDITN